LLQKMPTYMAEEEEKINKALEKDDWQERIKKWKSVATNQESDSQRRSKIIDAENKSVLACLLTPVPANKISKRVESHFLKAAKRAAGLMILAKVMSLEGLQEDVCLDLANWFNASLRGRTNKLCHYLDKIESCGNNVEQFMRNSFFKAIRAVLAMIQRTRSKETVIRLLDSLQWRFLGRDHAMIHDSQIFKVLRDGDGSSKHPIRMAWGKRAGLKTWNVDEEPTNLQFCLLETFENLFFNLIARIVDADVATMKLKAKGTSVPLLERSKSVISTSVSESLLNDGINIIFKELNRYTESLTGFEGIDYQSFVILANKIAIKNAKDDEKNVIGADFKDEVLFDIEKVDNEAQKAKEAR